MTTLEGLAAGALILTGAGMVGGLVAVFIQMGRAIQLLHMLNGTVLLHTKDIGKLSRGQSFIFGRLGIHERDIGGEDESIVG